jgi:cysteine desulfurase
MPHATYNLNANATTPLCRPAELAMNRGALAGTPIGAADAVDACRASMAIRLGCDPGELVFAGSGSESGRLALESCVRALAESGPGPIGVVSTEIEHPAVLETLAGLEARGLARVRLVAPGHNGIVAPESVATAISGLPGKVGLVSVMLANHETGAIQPVAEIARLSHRAGALVHTDAVQAVGKVPVDTDVLGVDLLSLSAHKFEGPPGVGALVARGACIQWPGLAMAGTPHVAAIAGMAAALEHSMEGLAQRMVKLRALATRIRGDLAGVLPTTRFNSPRADECLPNTLCFTLPGWMDASGLGADDLVREFADRGIAISACGDRTQDGQRETSSTLLAMGLSERLARNSVRVSLQPSAGTPHIEAFFDALIRLAGGWCG